MMVFVTMVGNIIVTHYLFPKKYSVCLSMLFVQYLLKYIILVIIMLNV